MNFSPNRFADQMRYLASNIVLILYRLAIMSGAFHLVVERLCRPKPDEPVLASEQTRHIHRVVLVPP
jgi:hypothetical protein